MTIQESLFVETASAKIDEIPALLNAKAYEKVIVAFSGGKDSLACILHLLDLGVSKDDIELWHHSIDGNVSAEDDRLMDWPVTSDYCVQVANALGLPIFMSWREGGFKREMLRNQTSTGAVWTESPNGLVRGESKGDKLGTRLKFPQVSPNLAVRWCSAYLKIDVAARAITMQPRFNQGRFLIVTGERAQESSNRAKYKVSEPHRTNNRKRHVTQWRPVLHWDEATVWEVIERHRVRSHPAYDIGLSRVSCMCCIFSSPKQWATIKVIAPEQFKKIVQYEQDFGVTIRRNESVTQAASSCDALFVSDELRNLAMSEKFTLPVIVGKNEEWTMPKGAFGECSGPT
jgi:3'-phosphoadenosine 5'-phosphosulfate sulfotransferase (PAPS reductase)/FAD synthetase